LWQCFKDGDRRPPLCEVIVEATSTFRRRHLLDAVALFGRGDREIHFGSLNELFESIDGIQLELS
jgi:hypothetical protein